MPDWSAARYLRCAGERTRPCRDLAARIERAPRTVIDLGCGPGNSTAVLAEQWPAADITGLECRPPVGAGLCRALSEAVRPRRGVAVQMPAASDFPAQVAIRDLARSERWLGRFRDPVVDWHTHDASYYYDVLGTGLRPFLGALAPEDRDRFLAEYLEAIRPAYPRQADGRILFPFRRLFLIARH